MVELLFANRLSSFYYLRMKQFIPSSPPVSPPFPPPLITTFPFPSINELKNSLRPKLFRPAPDLAVDLLSLTHTLSPFFGFYLEGAVLYDLFHTTQFSSVLFFSFLSPFCAVVVVGLVCSRLRYAEHGVWSMDTMVDCLK
jgi:hypothetical protein